MENLTPVINWHKSELILLSKSLINNSKCRLIEGDFFEMANPQDEFDPIHPRRKFDVVLPDINHAPDFHPAAACAKFYQPACPKKLAQQLDPGGAFALWSNDPLVQLFINRMGSIFRTATAVEVPFYNPLQDRDFVKSIYLTCAQFQNFHGSPTPSGIE